MNISALFYYAESDTFLRYYTAADGTEYKVTKAGDLNDEYGYKIELCDGEKDENNHKVWRNLTEKDYTYICWDIVEE